MESAMFPEEPWVQYLGGLAVFLLVAWFALEILAMFFPPKPPDKLEDL